MILGRKIQFSIILCFYFIFLTNNTPCRGWRKKVPNTVSFFLWKVVRKCQNLIKKFYLRIKHLITIKHSNTHVNKKSKIKSRSLKNNLWSYTTFVVQNMTLAIKTGIIAHNVYSLAMPLNLKELKSKKDFFYSYLKYLYLKLWFVLESSSGT